MFQSCSYQFEPDLIEGTFHGYPPPPMHHHQQQLHHHQQQQHPQQQQQQQQHDLSSYFSWPCAPSSFVGMSGTPRPPLAHGQGQGQQMAPPPQQHQQHNIFGGHGQATSPRDLGGLGGGVGPGGLIVPQPMRQPRTIKTYHCRMCDQIFDNKSDLLVHSQQIHKADPKPYRCPQCHKCFANSSYLSQHARIHAGIKPYKCQICERRFTQLCHLQQHIRTHTGEKPYKCQHPGCGKAFSQLSNLQSHSRSHMTDKPYRCNSCYKCYADEQGLREHIPKHSETKHLKTHICHVCGKSYTQETYLARHMTKHQGVDVSAAAAAAVANVASLGRMNQQNQQQQMMEQQIKHENSAMLHPSVSLNTQDLVSSSIASSRPNSAFLPLPSISAASSHPQFPPSAASLLSSSPSTSHVPSSPFPFGAPSSMPGPRRLTPPPLPGPPQPLPSPSPRSTSAYPFSFGGIGGNAGGNNGGGMRGDLVEPHGNMMANTLLSLQQIKTFNQAHPHPVFPKSEPSSPALHKDFP